jgi:DNA (cytosine-5)-methyltransferase 1
MGADDFAISPELTLNDALFGFGDAVCVPVVEWIVMNYLDPLNSEYGQMIRRFRQEAAA